MVSIHKLTHWLSANFYAAPTSSDSNHYFPAAYTHDGVAELVLTINQINGGTQVPTLTTNSSAGIMVGGTYTVINS